MINGLVGLPTLQMNYSNAPKAPAQKWIKRKGGAGFAVGIAIADVIHAIALDSHQVLPVSSVQNGCYGIRDVALSVPTEVCRTGVAQTLEIDLWPKEVQGLKRSGSVLRETLGKVLQRIGRAV